VTSEETLHFHGVEDQRPHSRACGWRNHPHGPDCSTNCPTCGGKYVEPATSDRVQPDTPRAADRLATLRPLEEAVLDAVRANDLRAAARLLREALGDPLPIADRLEDAAVAVRALKDAKGAL
jgi:hypothetical protein